MSQQVKVPRLSRQERDRRWTKVRAIMAQRGLQALVIRSLSAKWDAQSANVRYLCHIGGNGEEGYAVFPLEGEPTVYIWHPGGIPWWKQAQDWVSDVRTAPGRLWMDAVIERLKDLGISTGRVGVVGLGGLVEPEGIVPYYAFVKLQAAFPRVTFEDATDILEDMRLIKSKEEIAFIEKAAEIADKAIETMVQTARPGVIDYVVYAEMVRTMLANGSEPPMLLWHAGKEVYHASRLPSSAPLEIGDIILNEITPRYGGYWAHPHQPVSIGKPSREFQTMFDMALEGFWRGLEALKPGRTLEEVDHIITDPIEKAGYTWTRQVIHGIGLETPEHPWSSVRGDVVTPEGGKLWREATPKGLVIQPGMVLALQPIVCDPIRKLGIPIGDTVVVEEHGARRLSRRKLELIVVE